MFLFIFLFKTMLRFCSVLLASVCNLMLMIIGFISNYAYRSKCGVVVENGSNFSANRSQEDEKVIPNTSKECSKLQKGEQDINGGNREETGDSVFLQGGLISTSSKYRFTSGENVIGFLEEPNNAEFSIEEMFVEGSDEVLVASSDDQHLDDEIPRRKDSLFEHEFGEGLHSFSFSFNLFKNSSCSAIEGISDMDSMIDWESADYNRAREGFCPEDVSYEESEKLSSNDSEDSFYEVELLPVGQLLTVDANQESDCAGGDEKIELTDEAFLVGDGSTNQRSDVLDENERVIDRESSIIEKLSLGMKRVEDLDDEYIEWEPLSLSLTRASKESAIFDDFANQGEKLQERHISHEQKDHWDFDSDGRDDDDDDDDDDEDVLWEHQNLVRQMKMELKNCRTRGLPTISEDCESPKMVEDLKPLKIDHKVEYKDVMDEIHMFYKSYSEKMRKLDVLNYQTLHAISFLQLKDSEVFTACKKKADSVTFNLLNIWPRKGQRIYADPIHKSINEMHCDLEWVYVGQLCLSWEVLCWLYLKARELLKHDSEVINRSYNRAAEEFQQFQVLMQRFVEDEPFHQGQRNQNYVRNRCMIRSLLQVPMIKDDCLKAKNERSEETDAVSLELLTEMIRESMLIFREFLFSDKRTANVVLKGIHGTKIDLQNPQNPELLIDIITNLQKKDRRIKEHIRSQNCIVKKFKKHQQCRSDIEVLKSQVELRLVSRVLCLSKLTTDQLVWCQNKLNNINFVGRKVHVEPSFLLFPC